MLHPMLARQLRKLGLTEDAVPTDAAAWAQLLERVSRGYTDADNDRYTLERSLTVSSAEMLKLNEELKGASRAKSEFLANMSHEIRTPLNGVIGMTDLMLTTALTPQQAKYARLIQSSGQALLSVINDILDFSKIEAGKLDLERIDFDLTAIVEEAAEMLAVKAAAKGLEMVVQVDPAVPATVRGDPDRLRQVLINLANNAVKFTERGEVVIRVTPDATPSAAPEDAGAVGVRIAVTDTGIGIPADRLDRLFKAFSQADASTTRKYGGTGLGLCISQQLAALMGARIDVVSEVGKGSTFSFAPRFERPKAQSAQGPRVVPPALVGLRVLVVDDNAAHLEILTEQLRGWGFDVIAAADGPTGIAAARAAVAAGRPPRLAVVDLNMPGMNGLEVGRSIKADAALAGTVLVLFTALNQPLDAEMLAAAGFVAHLTKPLRQSHLFDTIVTGLAAQANGREAHAPAVHRAPQRAGSAPAKARVLVAEDNEINQMVAEEMLRQLGYDVDVAANGRLAVAAAAGRAYDLVLMDCQMPEMDGFEATRLLRAASAGAAGTPATVPIVALTANAFQEDRDRCLAAGMDDYLSKPLDPEKLAEAMQRYLARGGVRAPAA
jgi:signal transduction histidine kinase/DNA-binding response OmpR family regulator